MVVFALSASTTVFAAAPVLESDVFPQSAVVSLRLERSLAPSRPAASEAERAALPASYRFGLSLLRSRVQRERAEARDIAERIAAQTELLADREKHVDDLRLLLSSQDQLIGALQGRLREVGAQRRAVLATAAISPVVAAAPVQASTPAGVPAIPPASSSPVTAGPLSLATFWPPSDELLMQAGLLLVVILLLGCVLTLRSRLAGDRLEAEEAARGVHAAAGNDDLLREELRRRAGAPRVAPDLAGAGHEPLDMPAASPVSATSAGPGPLGVVGGRSGADPKLLKEVDTLIAFEDYDRAAALLRQQIDKHPRNPEYRLRLLHIESAKGNIEASEVEEEILAGIMMDGPLSATINRVLCAGRDMLPGHPLFEAGGWRAAEGGDSVPVDRTLRLVPPAR